jgi:hypothetical protein
VPTQSRNRKLTPAQFGWRFAREKAAQQRRYCDAFALWQTCRMKPCRRLRACRGDPGFCLKSALKRLGHAAQYRVREAILTATPRNIGGPERAARQSMPYDLCKEPVEKATADYDAARRRQRMLKGF